MATKHVDAMLIFSSKSFQAELDTDLGRLERWENIGLSKTPLNDRYFSHPGASLIKLVFFVIVAVTK
jgi:hypothetical protein